MTEKTILLTIPGNPITVNPVELPVLPGNMSWGIEHRSKTKFLSQDTDIWNLHVLDEDYVSICHYYQISSDGGLTVIHDDVLECADWLLKRLGLS